jgi:putative transposase
VNRTHKTRIYPNNEQETILLKHCGCTRLAYNACLAKWNSDYEQGTKHNYYSIKKWFNSIKKEQYPFVYEVSKWAIEASIQNLSAAFRKKYSKQNKHPKFHKKGEHDSFRIDGSVIKVEGKILHLPKKLNLKMAEELRWTNNKIYNVTISKRANKWFASFSMEVPDSTNENQVGAVGIDLGVKEVATCSDGRVYNNLKLERTYRNKLARCQRLLARKTKGSRNRHKQKIKLANLYYRIDCIKKDSIHKMTHEVAKKYQTICLEDLNVSGMLKNHKLAKAVADVSFAEIRRQFEYKAQEVKFVDRFYPSSKTCSMCGQIHDMPLSQRYMICNCGNNLDRDLNASINILRAACPEVTPVDSKALATGRSRNLTANLTSQVRIS